jgi:hypothetical protein
MRGLALMSAIASLLFAVPAWPDELSPSRSTSVSENAAPFPVDPAAQDSADAQRSWADRFQRALDDERYKVSLDTRARIGLADFEGNRKAYAYTVRSRSTTHASSATSAGARTSRPSTRLASPPTSGSTGLRPPTLTSGTSTASHQTRGRKRRGTGTHVHTS